MWLVVGLGNPGDKYLLTRHNIGFIALDAFVSSFDGPPPTAKTEHKAITCRFQMEGETFLFAKPQTYMNLSGESVQKLLHYYKIDLDHLLVIHDEVDLPFGTLKLQRDRGPGGHNGIKSIHQCLGTQDYTRLRVGVGRPADSRQEVSSYVLQNFSEEEQEALPKFLNKAGDAIESLVIKGFQKTATLFNR